METKERKSNQTNAGNTQLGCCSPEDIKEMFENMCKCFPGADDSGDFSTTQVDRMKRMMEGWCPFDLKDFKRNAGRKKRPVRKAEATEKEADGS